MALDLCFRFFFLNEPENLSFRLRIGAMTRRLKP